MRVNVESSIFGDARLKVLAMTLGVPWTHALGLLVTVWHSACVRRSEVVPEIEVDAVAELRGMADAMVTSQLATRVKAGLRIAGVKDRIEWLHKQESKAKLGAAARWKDAHGHASGHTAGNATGHPVGQNSLMPYSPAPSPALAPDLKEENVGAASASSRQLRVVSSEAADVAAYLLEAIASHKPDFSQSTAAWPKQSDVLLKKPGITVARLKTAIDYAHRDPTAWSKWRANILSVKKLGEQLDTLEAQMRQPPIGRPLPPRQQTLEEAGILDVDEYRRRLNGKQEAP